AIFRGGGNQGRRHALRRRRGGPRRRGIDKRQHGGTFQNVASRQQHAGAFKMAALLCSSVYSRESGIQGPWQKSVGLPFRGVERRNIGEFTAPRPAPRPAPP